MVQSHEEREIVEETKRKNQNAFKEEMWFLVHVPKPGFGNTNDGSIPRRFFTQPDVASRMTGIDINILKFKTILETLSSGFKINDRKFSDFIYKTGWEYVKFTVGTPKCP